MSIDGRKVLQAVTVGHPQKCVSKATRIFSLVDVDAHTRELPEHLKDLYTKLCQVRLELKKQYLSLSNTILSPATIQTSTYFERENHILQHRAEEFVAAREYFWSRVRNEFPSMRSDTLAIIGARNGRLYVDDTGDHC